MGFESLYLEVGPLVLFETPYMGVRYFNGAASWGRVVKLKKNLGVKARLFLKIGGLKIWRIFRLAYAQRLVGI